MLELGEACEYTHAEAYRKCHVREYRYGMDKPESEMLLWHGLVIFIL